MNDRNKETLPTHPEFAVRAETFNRYFDKPLPRSTFHDLVKKGKIIPMKGIRGLYLLNDSLRRLGLREVAKLPFEVPARKPEELILMAFHGMDPEVFEAPSWLWSVEAIDEADFHHAQSIVAQHVSALSEFAEDRLKHGYLQGVLDAAAIEAEDRAATG